MGFMSTAEELYKLYPRHESKKYAIGKIKQALNRIDRELIEEGIIGVNPVEWLKERVSLFAESPAGNRGHYTPHPSTWFNQSRYLDDVNEWFRMTAQQEAEFRMRSEANVGVWRP